MCVGMQVRTTQRSRAGKVSCSGGLLSISISIAINHIAFQNGYVLELSRVKREARILLYL